MVLLMRLAVPVVRSGSCYGAGMDLIFLSEPDA